MMTLSTFVQRGRKGAWYASRYVFVLAGVLVLSRPGRAAMVWAAKNLNNAVAIGASGEPNKHKTVT